MPLLALSGAAFLAAVLLIPLIKRLAWRVNLVDHPAAGAHKSHHHPTPYGGGVAIFLGLALALAAGECWLPGLLSGDSLLLVGGGAILLLLGLLDVWLTRRLRAALGSLSSLLSATLSLYHGQFLGRETPQSWSISLRERLRSKFLRHLLDVARHWERIGRHDAAIQCYQKGLEVDDLAEVFYQRLMVCYQLLGRKSEALAVYRRCRKTLSLILSIPPSSATEAIHRRLNQA